MDGPHGWWAKIGTNLDFERDRRWLICSTSSLSLYSFDSLLTKYLNQLPLRRTIRKEYLKKKFITKYLHDFSEIRKSFKASISNDNEKRNDDNDVQGIHPCLYFSKVQWTLKAGPKGSMGSFELIFSVLLFWRKNQWLSTRTEPRRSHGHRL